MRYVFLSFLMLISIFGRSQTEPVPAAQPAVVKLEKMLVSMSDSIAACKDLTQRDILNMAFLSMLEEALESEGAIDYPFDKLPAISDLKSPSNDFRIFSWEWENREGLNSYYGLILYETEGRYEVIQLMQNDSDNKVTEYNNINLENWYGAIYYDLLEVKNKNDEYYLLLGINRSEQLTKTKFIEPFFVDEKVRLGKEVFVFPDGNKFKRKIYTYSSEADMTIIFEKEDERIVMDHLSPEKPVYEGKYEFYVPDLSFDQLLFKKGRWNYIPDYDGRLDKNLKDRYYEMELPGQEKMY